MFGSTISMGASNVLSSSTAIDLLDDILLTFGNDGDIVMLNRSSVLNANTAVTSVLIGTPVSQALAANSLIISNVTASGDIAMYGNYGGNSQQFLWFDASTPSLQIGGTNIKTIFAGAAAAPAPDSIVHIWAGTAGNVSALAGTGLTVENSGVNYIQMLSPIANENAILFGDTTSNILGYIAYRNSSHATNPNTMIFQIAGAAQAYWTDGTFAFQKATTISTSTGELKLKSTGSIYFNVDTAQDVIAWGDAVGTSRSFILRGSTATDGQANDSPSFILRARYDADAGAGVTSTDWNYSILHDMITAGATPKSQATHSINSVAVMALENNNGVISQYMQPSNGGATNIGTSCNFKRFYSEVTLATDSAETDVGLTPAAVILSAAIRVSVEIQGLDSADHHIQLGINGTADKYIDVAQGSAATTISVNKKGKYTFDPTTDTEAAALKLTITGGADQIPSAGKVYVEVIYLDSTNLADV